MPAVPSGSKILVTGASGFIAVHIVTQLLEEGFQVVGTVRSTDKGEYLVKRFGGKPFTYIIVKDLEEPGAFDGKLEGIAGVLHTASPVFFPPPGFDPNVLIGPAVKGTTSVLEAAKTSKTIQRVVVTSSAITLCVPRAPPCEWTEDDWNMDAVKLVEEKGKGADPLSIYTTSKILAEKAAWSFIEEHKPEWDLTTLLPPMVYGPMLQDVKTIDKANYSVSVLLNILSGKTKAEDLPGSPNYWVDARDIARAHVRALTVPEAGGLRIAVSAGPYVDQHITEILAKLYPDLPNVPQGRPGAAQEVTDPSNAPIISNVRSKEVLGMEYNSLEKCIKDLYESCKASGLL